MNNYFPLALIAQTFCLAAFVVHRFIKPLGSDLMFGVFTISAILGIYLLWQSFRNPEVQGVQKVLGILLGILPIIFVILLVWFFSNFTWHS